MFDKEKFKNTLLSARGNRTNEDYSKDSSVSRAYISNYINMKRETPPNPDILRKLASNSNNNITYKDLMVAADYMEEDVSNSTNISVDDYSLHDEFSKNSFIVSVGPSSYNVNTDKETLSIMKEISYRPELKKLFNITKDAKKSDIEKVIKIITALREDD